MMNSELDLLAEKIADKLTNSTPYRDRVLTAEMVAEYLHVKPRTVIEVYSRRASFPKPFELPKKDAVKGVRVRRELRWRMGDLLDWQENAVNE